MTQKHLCIHFKHCRQEKKDLVALYYHSWALGPHFKDQSQIMKLKHTAKESITYRFTVYKCRLMKGTSTRCRPRLVSIKNFFEQKLSTLMIWTTGSPLLSIIVRFRENLQIFWHRNSYEWMEKERMWLLHGMRSSAVWRRYHKKAEIVPSQSFSQIIWFAYFSFALLGICIYFMSLQVPGITGWGGI